MKLKIHMKSGKTLIQRGVKDWSLKHNNQQMTELSIEVYFWSTLTIIMASLDLSSVEAITRH